MHTQIFIWQGSNTVVRTKYKVQYTHNLPSRAYKGDNLQVFIGRIPHNPSQVNCSTPPRVACAMIII